MDVRIDETTYRARVVPASTLPKRIVEGLSSAAVDVAMSLLFGLLLVRDTPMLPEQRSGWVVAGLVLAPGVAQRVWFALRWPGDTEPNDTKLWIKVGALALTLAVGRTAVANGIPPSIAMGAVATRFIGLTVYQRVRSPYFLWGVVTGVVVMVAWRRGEDLTLFSGGGPGIGATVRDVLNLSAVVIVFGIIGAQVRRESEESTRIEQALAAERTRIARELHDVVAHQMTGVILQAQGAASVLDTDRPRAAAALRSIEEGSRAALVEMRRLLGVLREGESGASAPAADVSRGAPQPTLEDLTQLISAYNRSTAPKPDDRDHDDFNPQELLAGGREPDAAGRTVVLLSVSNGAQAAPVGLQTSAHRIVQEAFTNIARHVGRASVDIDIRVSGGDLVVRVANGPPVEPPTAQIAGAGMGLRGMRERVEALGGTFRAGPDGAGGWEVVATMPLAAGSTSAGQTGRP